MKKGLFIILLVFIGLSCKISSKAEEQEIKSKGRLLFEDGKIDFDSNDFKYLQKEINRLYQECGKDVKAENA